MITGSGLAAVGFGLAASVAWGSGDFSGGFATKRAHIFAVMIGSYLVGLVLLVALAAAQSEPLPTVTDTIWAILAGFAGATGLAAQYRALAVGRMGIVAPVAAVLGAAFPVLVSAILEGAPGMVQRAGFGLALVGVWLIARPHPPRSTTVSDVGVGQALPTHNRSGLGLAVISGLGSGFFFILIDHVSENAIYWPLVAARGASLLILIAVVQISRRAWKPARAALPIILLAGSLDVGGNTFFMLAAQSGRLDVVSVLASLYPAVTVMLARVILNEEITRVQSIGILAAITAIPLIAA